MTRTILLAQEFGSNLGHVSRILAVARHLGPHRFVFAVPQAEVARSAIREALGPQAEVVDGMGFRGHPIPRVSGTADRTIADVFYALGYADPVTLGAAARRWGALVDSVQPDFLLSDFAPTLRLATWDECPHVVLGDAYTMPPPGMRLPSFKPANVPVEPLSAWREDRLLEAARTVRDELEGPPIEHFSDVFQGDQSFASVIAGCDPYGSLRPTRPTGPISTPAISCGPAHQERRGPDIFCFLWSDHPGVNTILTALNGIERRSEVHIRGLAPNLLARHCAPQVGVRPGLADFSTLLPQTRLFIHYGGSGATYAAILAGTTQLIFPRYLDQEGMAAGMVEAGVGSTVHLGASADVARLRAIILRQLDDKAMEGAALAYAEHHRRIRNPDALAEVVETCRRLLDDGKAR